MAKIYYINHKGYSDTAPHYGEYDTDVQVMDTGKRWTKSFQTNNYQEAKDFLLNNFKIIWNDEDIKLFNKSSVIIKEANIK